MPRGGWHPYGGVYRPQVVVRSYRDAVFPAPVFFYPTPFEGGLVITLGRAVMPAVAGLGREALPAVATMGVGVEPSVSVLGREVLGAVKGLGREVVPAVGSFGYEVNK